MAQDEVIVVYKAVPEGFDKVGVAVNSVTNETKELQTQIKATFADKSIENATRKLYEQGDVMGALINEYGNATSALKAMEKELITMAALGQNGTKEFKELAKATAELKDTVGDTRGEIKKMASDTKVFDTMVQGARGVAAAFSVATGVAAAFGSENKNVEKALLKVQGAMAALQGVQELANIATEKGGIATKAYGVALTVVDKISKVTGLSMAASWALATAGVTLVIAGVVALIAYLGDANEASDTYAKDEAERQKEEAKIQKETQEQKMAEISAYEKKKFEEQEYWRKKEQIAGKDVRAVEIGQLEENIAYYKNFLIRSTVLGQEYFNEYKDLSKEQYNELRLIADKYVIDAEIKRQDLLAQIRKDAIKKQREREKESAKGIKPVTPGIAAFKPSNEDNIEPFITEEIVSENKTNADQMAKDLMASVNAAKKADEISISERKKLYDDYFNSIQSGLGAVGSFISSMFASQTQSIENQGKEQQDILLAQKDKEIFSVGENAERKRAIEERYAKKKMDLERKMAIEKAKIDRQQAITNKAIAIFTIAINTARAVSEYIGGLPGTAALMAIAIATGAIEAAAVAAQPLPEIPKFEKGGAVALAGGRIDNGYLIGRSHREGGILIEAQGQEYIWDEQTTAKHGDIIQAAHENRIEDLMMHKYVVPIMKNKMKADSDSYDDWLLRATIKNGQKADKKNAEYIADKVSESVNSAIYNQNRYR